ncbi:hypothetical protein BDY17DRAFT_157914 [Neohortaea acidophila]|uniref:N-acetylgalactosaminide beta-1,3-galactosyltransferase n=1 Tax=Neohortaea acidophila TaxID=245834 RepID=A0A6A6PQG6_9PEZI|nr:uncharacterized protein BDY17DRAFT_157914 [Neohortaea acidophila]KAF2482309.1 hypothetical protein BDY17DRAFT_157914 [Neohortaea acidophila]
MLHTRRVSSTMSHPKRISSQSWKELGISTRPLAPAYRRRFQQRPLYFLLGIALVLYLLYTQRSSNRISSEDGRSRTWVQYEAALGLGSSQKTLPCRSLPGAEDVLVVLKTGSTELEDKLPVHLTTTLRCYPNYMIFSDYEEDFRGEHIYDALEFVDPKIQETHEDFELWRRLRNAGGRSALLPSERSGPVSTPPGATGKKSNPGWKLDKWKFLPMMNRTLYEHPDKKWYIFVETDTYIMWQTALNYLAALDHKQPIYMGGQVWIGEILFAHGGTGFAVSAPALRQVVERFQNHQKEYEAFTHWHWAGDCVLGKAMKEAGAPLMGVWPIWQADGIGDMHYRRDEGGLRLWCMPSVSYHHLTPVQVESMWTWEQEWMAKTKDPRAIVHHRDVYNQYVLPRITAPKQNWNNHADEDQGPVNSLDECRAICTALPACVQYALSLDLRCMTTARANLGEWSRGIDSGWIHDRMVDFHDNATLCKKERNWITRGVAKQQFVHEIAPQVLH